jgi:hypothetical protein
MINYADPNMLSAATQRNNIAQAMMAQRPNLAATPTPMPGPGSTMPPPGMPNQGGVVPNALGSGAPSPGLGALGMAPPPTALGQQPPPVTPPPPAVGGAAPAPSSQLAPPPPAGPPTPWGSPAGAPGTGAPDTTVRTLPTGTTPQVTPRLAQPTMGLATKPAGGSGGYGGMPTGGIDPSILAQLTGART